MAKRGGNPRNRNGHRRRAIVARVLSRDGVCWMCELPLDRSLPNLHPEQPVVDELVPVSQGGSPYQGGNCVGAHRCCNNWRKAKPVGMVERVKAVVAAEMGGASSPEEWCAKASAALRAIRSRCSAKSLAPPRPSTEW